MFQCASPLIPLITAKRYLGFQEFEYLTRRLVRPFQWRKVAAPFYDRKPRALDVLLIEAAVLERYKTVRFTPQNQRGSAHAV